MSVKRQGDQYKATCDGPGAGSGCDNHHLFGVSQEEIKAADDWLTRRGWRTIKGEKHFCRFCGQKVEELQP